MPLAGLVLNRVHRTARRGCRPSARPWPRPRPGRARRAGDRGAAAACTPTGCSCSPRATAGCATASRGAHRGVQSPRCRRSRPTCTTWTACARSARRSRLSVRLGNGQGRPGLTRSQTTELPAHYPVCAGPGPRASIAPPRAKQLRTGSSRLARCLRRSRASLGQRRDRVLVLGRGRLEQVAPGRDVRRRRSSARRSRSVMPPQTPNSTWLSSASARHSVRTGQPRQIALARFCAAPCTNSASGSACPATRPAGPLDRPQHRLPPRPSHGPRPRLSSSAVAVRDSR